MCTVDDTDIDGESLMVKEENLALDEDTQCVKCKGKACLVLRRNNSYCKDCFLIHVDHKCRASLGKSKQMKPSDKVLVGFSGSPSAAVLLHVLSTGKRKDDHKKLMYPILFCYVDDGNIFGESLDKRKSVVKKARALVESYGFEFHLSTLSKAWTDDGPVISDLDSEDIEIPAYFKALRTQTSKEDFLSKLRQRVLVRVARFLKCNKIFTSENQDSVSIKLLTKIALGMGEQLSDEVGFQDSRYPDISLLRPLSDIDSKSIAYYVELNNLTTMQQPAWPASSIQKLTSNFINGLQEEFPSTVSTIYRTGTKCSGVKRKSDESEVTCLLCDVTVIEKPQLSYSAEDAMTFTKSVSQAKNCGQCSCSKPSQELLNNSFCHTCLNIVSEMDSIQQLPANVLAKLMERKSLNSMLKEIEDFLL